jgi:TPR repeat protein
MDKAIRWYRKAKDLGHVEAHDRLQALLIYRKKEPYVPY